MSIFRTDDPLADFESWDAEQQKTSEQLPTCCECGEKIRDDFCYEIEGEPICGECMYEHHRISVECFM